MYVSEMLVLNKFLETKQLLLLKLLVLSNIFVLYGENKCFEKDASMQIK